ncbi:transposase [Paenibacillus lupini]|uniref:transposase n=1 Tax=Paenibacillus lupini TaxID=1450204 RepID=UPI001FB9317C|nr:transposase [Paenibacillus lupini]NIK25102.1 hypothetical protein [Paenibacillus lupini]
MFFQSPLLGDSLNQRGKVGIPSQKRPLTLLQNHLTAPSTLNLFMNAQTKRSQPLLKWRYHPTILSKEDIPENHLVRVINDAVNRLDMNLFTKAYPGGGRDSYHPKMLLKVIIYAYTKRIYSSRQIAKAVRENIMFIWLAARQRRDNSPQHYFHGNYFVNLLKRAVL